MRISQILTKIHFCAYLIMCLLFPSHAEAAEIIIATGVNHDPPYVYGSREISSDYPGVTIDLLRVLETRIGIKFIIKKKPWKRVVNEVRNNSIDGGFHFSFKEKRSSFVAYPIPDGSLIPDPQYCISNRSYVIYRLKGQSTHWNGKKIILNSEGNHLIGAIRGGSITDDIKKLGHNLYEVNTDEQLLKLLLSKRIHTFIGLENMIDAKIKTLATEERNLIEKSLPPVIIKPYYIAFSKKFYLEHPETAWQIWKGVAQIKKSGELQKFFSKYVNKH